MQFLFNLAVIVSLAYVLLGADRFEHHWNQLRAVASPTSSSADESLNKGLDLIEAKVDRLMRTVEAELDEQQDNRSSAGETVSEVASEESGQDESGMEQADTLPDSTAVQSISEDRNEMLSELTESAEPRLISLSDRAYALDQLLMELELDVASR